MTHDTHLHDTHLIEASSPTWYPARARTAVWLIRVYQMARAGHVSPCRFTPSCSAYAVEALSIHGTRRGLSLVARRLLRCRPGGPFGYDPVPPASE